jgi:hypothetical protein
LSGGDLKVNGAPLQLEALQLTPAKKPRLYCLAAQYDCGSTSLAMAVPKFAAALSMATAKQSVSRKTCRCRIKELNAKRKYWQRSAGGPGQVSGGFAADACSPLNFG